VLLDELLEVIENFSLALGEGLHGPTLCKRKAKVNELGN
jgi:hypothetical protein